MPQRWFRFRTGPSNWWRNSRRCGSRADILLSAAKPARTTFFAKSAKNHARMRKWFAGARPVLIRQSLDERGHWRPSFDTPWPVSWNPLS